MRRGRSPPASILLDNVKLSYMQPSNKNLIQIHLAVFLFGFAALFGKFLDLPTEIIVFGRTFIATIAMVIFMIFTKSNFKLRTKRDYFIFFGIGIIYSIHWYTFFKSIQVSSVAIGVLTFSTFPIFVTLLEPVLLNEKFQISNLISAVLCLLGISLVIPSFELSNNFTQGAMWGIAAGLSCAILTICSKANIQRYSSTTISFYQQLSATLVFLPFIGISKVHITQKDFFLILLLGILFTAVTQKLYISSLKTIKAQLASIITCLEPIYSIILAIIFLKEIPSFKTLIGGLIILLAIIFETLKTRKDFTSLRTECPPEADPNKVWQSDTCHPEPKL